MRSKFKRKYNLVSLVKSKKISVPKEIIQDERTQIIYVSIEDINKILVNETDRLGRPYKKRTLRNLLNTKYMKENLKELPTLSQFRELKKIVYLERYGFLYNKKLLCDLILAGVNDRYILRLSILSNLKATDSKLNFITIYGYKLGLEKWKELKSDKIKGDKNPAYQHGGKFSPFSTKFVKYKDDPDSEEKIKSLKKQVSDTRKENHSYNSTLEYYLTRGYSEEEAEKALSKRQSTFSLEKCIQRYGEEEGTKVWKERQDNWQETLNSKSKEEKDRIRQAKSTGRMCQLFNSDESVKYIDGVVYFIKFSHNGTEFWKIGITSVGVDRRFKEKTLSKRFSIEMEVLYELKSSFYKCFKIEQNILRKYKEKRINIDIEGFQSTECFSEDIFKGNYNEIETFRHDH